MKRHECKIDLMNILFCMLKGTLCLAASCSRGTHAHTGNSSLWLNLQMTELSLLVKNERAWPHAVFPQSRRHWALVVAAAVNGSPPSKSQHPAPAGGEKYLHRLEGWLPPGGTGGEVERRQPQISLLRPRLHPPRPVPRTKRDVEGFFLLL